MFLLWWEKEEIGSGFNCVLRGLKIDYKKQGEAAMNVVPYVRDSSFGGAISIGIKDGKYRITISEIFYNYKGSLNNYGLTGIDDDPIEDVTVRNSKPEFRKSQNLALKLISTEFENLFDYNNITSHPAGEDNW